MIQLKPLFFLLLSLITLHTKDLIDNKKKINEMNLLFPHIHENLDSRQIEYKLFAYNGCYEWFSSNQNYFNIQGIADEYNHRCQSSAVVTMVRSKPISQAVWIMAKDKETGDVLRVEAKISEIAKIEISTKSRIIDVGDMQVLEVVGYDKDGNMFSTLEGIKFEWTVSKCDNIIELVPIKDSLFKTTDLRKKLEAQSIQTDIIIVKGLNPGNCQINAKLVEKDYKMHSSSVKMYIMEHFAILPENELYVLKKSLVKYRLISMKRMDTSLFSEKEINLPSQNYHWKIDLASLGEIQQTGLLKVKYELGDLKVIVNDIKSENSVENVVHIVDPVKIELNILEFEESNKIDLNKDDIIFDNIWNLVLGRKYLVRAALYDYLDNRITLTDNFNIKFLFENPEHFEIIRRTHQDLVFVPKKKVERVFLRASFEEERISSEKSIAVHSQIKAVKPDPIIHLPAITSINQEEIQSIFKVFVIGGSGFYEWASEDLDVAIVSQEGWIKSKKKGKTIIEVHDKLNCKNKEKFEVEVTTLARVRSLEEFKEIIVKESDFIYVVGEDDNHRIYSNCSNYAFEIEKVFESAFDNFPDPNSYDAVLTDLEALSTSYKTFHSLFQSPIYKRKGLDLSLYQNYINLNELTIEKYQKIVRFYSNYGVCSRVRVGANYPSELLTKILSVPLNSAVTSASLSIRFIERFRIIQPNLELMNMIEPEILLAPESSVEWFLEGGPNIWEETRKINEIYEVEDRISGEATTRHSLTMGILSKTGGQKIKRHYLTRCNARSGNGNDLLYSIRIYSWNEPDSKLLKPVNASISLSLSCKVPSKLQIYPFEPYEPAMNIYQSKVLGLESINLKHFAEHYFQIFAFDKELVPFYNFSSLSFKWFVTKKVDCIVVHPLEAFIDEGICRVCKDQYTKLAVKDCDEELILRVETFSLKEIFAKFTFPLLWDELALSVLPNLQLTPQRVVLYYDLRNSVQIKISYGSGYFSVKTNDSEIVSFDYDRSLGIITVSPLKRGYAKIIVEDLKLERSKPVSCEIIVSEAFYLNLKTETNLMSVGNKTLMTVHVQESHYELFPVEQYQLMQIYLQVEIDSEYLRSNALRITNDDQKNYVFLVEGILVGSYKVKAFMVPHLQSSNLGYISSNVVEIHVFEPMSVRPSELLMSPGCFSTVELIGGPSEKSKVLNNVVMEAGIAHKNISSFKEIGSGIYEVFGLDAGKTTLNFVLKYKDSNRFISSVNMEITVELVRDVQILGMIDRTLHIGSVVRLIAISKYNNHLFSNQICNFHYTWKSTEPNVLFIPAQASISKIVIFLIYFCRSLSLHSKKSPKADLNIENYLNMAVNASAINEGSSEIILTLETRYERRFEGSILRTSVKVRVVEPLVTDIPVNFNQHTAQPALLLLPPNSGYKLITNKDPTKLKFSDFKGQSEGEIQIDQIGNIKTSQHLGKFTFLVEDYGVEKQLMVVNILVTNIYSIILENSYKVLYLPTDSEMKLNLILQDSFGRHFPKSLEFILDYLNIIPTIDIESVEFDLQITNPRVADLKVLSFEQSLVVKAKSVGSCMCFVYLTESPSVYDVFVINVGSIVSPSSPVFVHVGGFVYFTASLQNNYDYRWISEDPSIMEISTNGKALALKEGRTNIIISESIHHITRVNVYKATKILLNEAKSPAKITNIPHSLYYQDEYDFYFRVISDEREIKFFGSGKGGSEQINNNLRFDCEARDPEILQVKGEVVFSEDEGQPTPRCRVAMRHFGSGQYTTRSTKILVKVSSNTPNIFQLAQDFQIDIVPQFQISHNDFLIELNPSENTRVIKINSADELNFHADNEFIDHNIQSRFDPSQNLFSLTISIPENRIIKGVIESNLKIYDFLTNQTEFVKIIYDPGSSYSSNYYSSPSKGSPLGFSFLDGIITLICLLVLLLVLNQCKGQ